MTILEATRDFVDHVRVHASCLDACEQSLRSLHPRELNHLFCPTGLKELNLAVRRLE